MAIGQIQASPYTCIVCYYSTPTLLCKHVIIYIKIHRLTVLHIFIKYMICSYLLFTGTVNIAMCVVQMFYLSRTMCF